VGMVEVGAPISLDGVAVYPGCWCICLCYLHFAPENPEDGKMYLLVLAHLDCPRHSPESHKMVVVILVVVKIKNGSRDVTMPFSGTVCCHWVGTCYNQPANKI